MVRRTGPGASDTRTLVIAAAARLFRKHGFEGAGIDAIMAEAGLTHGWFQGHFTSKADLAAAAVAYGLREQADRLAAADTLAEYVQGYLTPAQRDDPGAGCVLAALAGDLARSAGPLRDGVALPLTQMLDRMTRMAGGTDPAAARLQAIVTLSALTGALILARAVGDPALSDEILAGARAALTGGDAPSGAVP